MMKKKKKDKNVIMGEGKNMIELRNITWDHTLERDFNHNAMRKNKL